VREDVDDNCEIHTRLSSKACIQTFWIVGRLRRYSIIRSGEAAR